MNIVFMGTPDFAVGTLDALVKAHNVVGVFTQPDKPKGRKFVLTPPPVKVAAEKYGIPVFQPQKVKDGMAAAQIKALNPDIIVVVAYGKILPIEILNMPKYGCVNIHASLLPRNRGASPIQWSIVCGDRNTGVTTMLMDEGMDTGDMLLCREIPIDDNDTAETLHDKLAKLGAELIIPTLEGIESGTLTPKKQPASGITYAPIIKKEMAQLDFSKTTNEIICAVRGYNPWPVAYFVANNKRIKVYSAVKSTLLAKPNEVLISNNKLVIGTADGAVELLEVQPEGSKRMSAADMLRGNKIENGSIIEVN